MVFPPPLSFRMRRQWRFSIIVRSFQDIACLFRDNILKLWKIFLQACSRSFQRLPGFWLLRWKKGWELEERSLPLTIV